MSFKTRRRKFIKDLGGNVLWKLEGYIGRASLIGDTPFFKREEFPWADDLEKNWKIIRKELDKVLEHQQTIPNFQDISKDQVVITNDDRWKTFFLYGMGYKAEDNCALCPETTRLVEKIPNMTTAFFSILSPRKHIPPHRGLFKGFVRYHLGIKIPRPSSLCRIRVDKEVRSWEEGKSLFFDDTYDHEAWNDSDETRVVLFVDVLRPLPFPASVINKSLISLVKRSAYVQDARRNQENWAAATKEAATVAATAET